MHKIIAAACSAVLLAGCASAGRKPGQAAPAQGPRPAWVDGSDAGYPRSRFLTGVSSADDLNAAKDRARGEISKVFSTQITLNTAVAASEYTSETQGRTSSASAQNVTQNVRAVSQKKLEGVEIAATWRDAAGQYFALAVLERAKALAALDGQALELDARARDTAALLAAAGDKLQKAKHALALLGLLKTRDALTADMRVLDPARGAAAGFDANAARRDAAAALAALDVALELTKENSAAVAAAVVKALNGLGIEARVAAAGPGTDIAAECAVELSAVADTDTRSRWRWHRGSAAVALKEVKTGKIFLTFDAAAKEASATAEEARQKTEAALGKKLGAEISRAIAAYLENQ
ncbi:MAG TPA: LPP20 family lipoprotein [Elusimicrobiales bacterium]|nr:LPP20 family lipoprotein [Elusimicrobiales bacterium]